MFLLMLSIILMVYFIFDENIYLYVVYAFIFTLTMLFDIVIIFLDVGFMGLGFYLISISYIFTILSLYYALDKINNNYQLEDIQKILYHKNTIILALSAWFIFILNILLIIVSHVRM